jgi:hypothetical protein
MKVLHLRDLERFQLLLKLLRDHGAQIKQNGSIAYADESLNNGSIAQDNLYIDFLTPRANVF